MIGEGETWLKGQGQLDTLCPGEVAEWLNAAVSKTVTSVIPASGVRIPPSPRPGASQPVSTLPAAACQLVSFSLGGDTPSLENETLLAGARSPPGDLGAYRKLKC